MSQSYVRVFLLTDLKHFESKQEKNKINYKLQLFKSVRFLCMEDLLL